MNPPICHITHFRNLPGILEQGGIWCDREAEQRGLTQQSIAHSHIKARRAKRDVTKCRGGKLCDYVPFYFWHHSPMLYAIHSGAVKGYEGGQGDVLYLVSSLHRVQQEKLPFAFTDGHADIDFSQQFDDPGDLQTKLDWKAVKATQWHDTNEDGDRKRRKQAEFLVHHFLPWPCITQIGVMGNDMMARVEVLLAAQAHRPPVQVRRAWYY